jgi:site-specific DNA-methyltransferase (adenine-specific)
MKTQSKIYLGDSQDILPTFEPKSIDLLVTDPPYFLMNKSGSGFMGKPWDSLYASKSNSILCESKEFANFVERIFGLMQVDLNTEEGYTVQNNANFGEYQKRAERPFNANALSAEKNSRDPPLISKVNISFVHGLALTKVEVLDLLPIRNIKNATVFKTLNEDALFVVPISYIIKNLKNTVAVNALKLPTKKLCAEKGILLTSMEEARIEGVIEAMTGTRSGRSVMLEMNGNVDTAGSIVEEKRYKHIILSHTGKEELTNYLISLLYVLFVMHELNKSPNSSFKDIKNRDMIYRFHKNWAIEAFRVLKPGAFGFVMSSPRSDLLPLVTTALRDVGFDTSFTSIYHTFASGFPKSQNLSKAAKKRNEKPQIIRELRNGFSGFQPKPAVEIVIVVMKPIEEKTYLDQALKNSHGCTYLDNCRIPFENAQKERLQRGRKNSSAGYKKYAESAGGNSGFVGKDYDCPNGRFLANVLCEDDVLNNGHISKSDGGTGVRSKTATFKGTEGRNHFHYDDAGSFSRYFSLDAWFGERIKRLPKEVQKTFPWLIIPKPSKSEKNKHLDIDFTDNSDIYNGKFPDSKADKEDINKHPTIKPVKLMSLLITLGSREGDIVLDPFLGSGTTYIAATALNRFCKGIEINKEYYDKAVKRCNLAQKNISAYF